MPQSALETKDSSGFDHEYSLMKTKLYQQFFKGFMAILVIPVGSETLKVAKSSNPIEIYSYAAFIISMVVIMGITMRLEKYSEKIMTGFFIFHYCSGFIRVYKTESGYFSDPTTTYYTGTNLAIYEGMICSRISRFSHQVIFTLVNVVLRFYLIFPDDHVLVLFHTFFILGKLLLGRNQDIHNEDLFRRYFNSKEQLVKFKNLVVHDFPQGIAILHKSLDKYLFSNDFFKGLNKDFYGEDIRSQLEKFVLKQSADGTESDASNSDSGSSEGEITLFTLIKRTFDGNQKNSQKVTCTVDLRMPPDSSQRGGPNILGVNVMEIIWDDEPAIAIITKDVTQQHKMMSLKIADVQKDVVLATVSHELRTPLNGMLGMIQIMEKKIYDSELKNYLSICKNSATLLLSLVNSILDLKQISANKLKLNYEKVDVQQLLKSIVSLFEFQCSKKGISIEVKMHSATPKMIVTDKDRLSQIFINLVGNAVKFTFHGGITITTRKASRITNDNDDVYFGIEDTGIGIKEEDQVKLFKVFGRLEHDDSGVNRQGVGLGLHISNNLVRALCPKEGESIKVKSEYGRGSCFSFMISSHKKQNRVLEQNSETLLKFQSHNEFSEHTACLAKKLNYYVWENKLSSDVFENPFRNKLTNLNSSTMIPPSSCFKNPFTDIQPSQFLRTDPGISKISPRKVESFSHFETTKPFVLIVDDNPFNVTVAEHMIKAIGFPIKSALSGEAAINLLVENNYNNQPIKMVFMDCQMPIMDGYETTRVLKEKMMKGEIPKIPVVALTANDSEKDRERCRKVGMCDYLTKPLNEQKLKDALQKYIGQ